MLATTASPMRHLLLLPRRTGPATTTAATTAVNALFGVPQAAIVSPPIAAAGIRRGLASQPARAPPTVDPCPHPPPHPYPHTLLHKPEAAQQQHPHQGSWLSSTAEEAEEGMEGAFDFERKTSVLMEVEDRPGALHEVIN